MYKIPINVNYHVLNSTFENWKYFLARGHFFVLLWDRMKWYWFPRFNIVPSFPQAVDIEISLSCQLKCPMCTREVMEKHKLNGIMGFDLYKKVVDECARHKVFSIKLSWRGEPLMNPHTVEMVRYAKKKGIRDVAFLTNGGLLTKERINELIDTGLDWISISIDGLGDDYERIRKPIKFDEIVETVKQFYYEKKKRRVKKPLVRIQTISSIVEKNPEYFTFWKPWVDRISSIAEKPLTNTDSINHDPDYICQSPFQRIFVTWNGDVVPCHGDYFLFNIFGNVQNQTILEIWHSERFKKIRSDMRDKKRLNYQACLRCADGCLFKRETLVLEGRKVPVIKYDIKNVKNMEPKKQYSDP